MIGTPRGVFLHQPRSHDEHMYRDREQEAFRQHRDRVFADIFQQRHASNHGPHSPFGHMGSRTPPMSFVPNMASMMGGHRRHGSSNPIDDFALGLGMMGGGPHMGMANSVGMGMGMGMPFGRSRPSLSRHQPYIRQRHSPFHSYNSPGPPRAHSFMPAQRSSYRHMHSPFHHPLQSPFSSSRTTLLGDDDSDDDEFETDFLVPPRRSPGRHSRRRHTNSSRLPSRRRRYRPSMYEDSEDEFDDYDDYEDDFDDEDVMDGYFSRPRRAARWMM